MGNSRLGEGGSEKADDVRRRAANVRASGVRLAEYGDVVSGAGAEMANSLNQELPQDVVDELGNRLLREMRELDSDN